MGDVRVGISGWTYPPWRGSFYPPGLVHRRELGYVAERLNSLEINGTFYARQRPTSFASWAASVPEDFVFAVKGPRFITHLKKLGDVAVPLANFYASGVLALGRRLGPFLWQLPPNLGYDAERMATFFHLLPRTAGEAAALAAFHDARVPEDQALTTAADPALRLRHTVEVRHETFRDPAFYALLRAHDIGLVVADNPGKWPIIEEVTSDFMYVRLHGREELYASGYSDAALDGWAAKLRGWAAAGLEGYVYCDNDVKVQAPYDAMGLLRRVLDAGAQPG